MQAAAAPYNGSLSGAVSAKLCAPAGAPRGRLEQRCPPWRGLAPAATHSAACISWGQPPQASAAATAIGCLMASPPSIFFPPLVERAPVRAGQRTRHRRPRRCSSGLPTRAAVCSWDPAPWAVQAAASTAAALRQARAVAQTRTRCAAAPPAAHARATPNPNAPAPADSLQPLQALRVAHLRPGESADHHPRSGGSRPAAAPTDD